MVQVAELAIVPVEGGYGALTLRSTGRVSFGRPLAASARAGQLERLACIPWPQGIVRCEPVEDPRLVGARDRRAGSALRVLRD
jgi:hypothetical protein